MATTNQRERRLQIGMYSIGLHWLICAAFLCLGGLAHGQTSTPVDIPVPPADIMQGAISAIVSTISDAFKNLVDNASIGEAGKTIAYSLFVIVFAWNLLKAMVQGDGITAIVAELIPLMGTLAIVIALLYNGGTGQIIGFMDSIAQSFGASAGLDADINASLTKGFTAVTNILSMPSATTNVPFSWRDPGPALGVAISAGVFLIAKIVTAFIVVIAIAIYIANVVLAHGSIMLALALAPVMVPFIMAPATSFIFDGWLRFTLGAGMLKVVGAFMIGFTDHLMSGLATLSEKIRLPANADYSTIMITSYVVYAGLILLAIFAAYLMMQTPGLASGLISGSAGGAGFKGMRALTGGVGMQAGRAMGAKAGGALNQLGSATKSYGHGIVGAGLSWLSGSSQQREKFADKQAMTPSERFGKVGGRVYQNLGGKVR